MELEPRSRLCPKTLRNTIRSGGSYLSSSDLRVRFGLGPRTKIHRLEMRWPTGEAQVIENPPLDHILIVEGGEGIIESRAFGKAATQAK